MLCNSSYDLNKQLLCAVLKMIDSFYSCLLGILLCDTLLVTELALDVYNKAIQNLVIFL